MISYIGCPCRLCLCLAPLTRYRGIFLWNPNFCLPPSIGRPGSGGRLKPKSDPVHIWPEETRMAGLQSGMGGTTIGWWWWSWCGLVIRQLRGVCRASERPFESVIRTVSSSSRNSGNDHCFRLFGLVTDRRRRRVAATVCSLGVGVGGHGRIVGCRSSVPLLSPEVPGWFEGGGLTNQGIY